MNRPVEKRHGLGQIAAIVDVLVDARRFAGNLLRCQLVQSVSKGTAEVKESSTPACGHHKGFRYNADDKSRHPDENVLV